MKLKSKHKEMKISFGWGFSNGQVLIETKNSSLRRTEKKTKKLWLKLAKINTKIGVKDKVKTNW